MKLLATKSKLVWPNEEGLCGFASFCNKCSNFDILDLEVLI